MSYSDTGGGLSHLVDVKEHVDNIEEALCLRMSYEIYDRVRRYTPVAKRPPGISFGKFAAERNRRPGTLKDSWEIGHLTKIGDIAWIEVYTEDPVAPHVEYDTRPHPIGRAKGSGVLRFRSMKTGEWVFREEVFHPGTTGQHMLGRAVTEVAANADRLMRGVVRGQWGKPRASIPPDLREARG